MAFRPFVRLLFFLLFLLYWYSANATANGSFSIQLIHRDSPRSPLHSPSTTPFHRFTEAIRRSLDRSYYSSGSRSSSLSTSSIRSVTSLDGGDYLMNFSVGTPPVQVSVLFDTGSDLLWSRCEPCVDCANRQAPRLYPTKSSSYKELPCDSSPCKFFNPNACEKGPNCNYAYSYGGGPSAVTTTMGILSTETLTFDSTDGDTISIDDMVLGCGHNNSLSFDDRLYWLAGAGGSTYSLISQLSSSIKGRFSYCFVPTEESVSSTSVMNFGDQAIISGPDVVSTPLISGDDKTLYFHISVGGNKIEVKPADASNSGNAFIDTGTTLTLLNADAFNQLTNILSSIVKLPSDNATGSLCFHATSRDGFPAITFHFAGGADLVLQPWNTYNELKNEGLVCLLMASVDGATILGNIIQQNFLVAYDLEGKKVSFKSTQCSKLSK